MIHQPTTLRLENGIEFSGTRFGADIPTTGEVVFNTAMTGYPESLTDPSYYGQILICSYPLIGNYGVPNHDLQALDSFFESNKIQIRGLIISYESVAYSHWNATESLSNWFQKNNIPGMHGVDTREAIKTIREYGSIMGSIGDEHPKTYTPITHHVAQVSTKDVKVYNEGGAVKIGLVDGGVKQNIIRNLIQRNCEVHLLPYQYNFNDQGFDGIFLSNGPGNPEDCTETIVHLEQALHENKQPIYGICLGSQLMGLAAGAQTYKLKFGHRGHNQPVIHVDTKQCYITSQNHGYAVDQNTLPNDWVMNYQNLNDGSCEGVRHKSKPFLAVQFHPEAFGGPTDTEFIFDDFMHDIQHFS